MYSQRWADRNHLSFCSQGCPVWVTHETPPTSSWWGRTACSPACAPQCWAILTTAAAFWKKSRHWIFRSAGSLTPWGMTGLSILERTLQKHLGGKIRHQQRWREGARSFSGSERCRLNKVKKRSVQSSQILCFVLAVLYNSSFFHLRAITVKNIIKNYGKSFTRSREKWSGLGFSSQEKAFSGRWTEVVVKYHLVAARESASARPPGPAGPAWVSPAPTPAPAEGCTALLGGKNPASKWRPTKPGLCPHIHVRLKPLCPEPLLRNPEEETWRRWAKCLSCARRGRARS